MQMMYLGSWAKLRQRGVVTRLEYFDVAVTMDPRDAESLFDEINGLLKADEELLDALTAVDEHCILHYRHAQTRSGSLSPCLCECASVKSYHNIQDRMTPEGGEPANHSHQPRRTQTCMVPV